MRYKLFIFLLIISLLILFTQNSYPQTNKQTIAILQITSVPFDEALNVAIEDILISELTLNLHYSLVERNEIKKLLNEWELSISGVISDERAIEIGELLGANYILLGRISKLQEIYRLSLKLVDVEKGTIKSSSLVKGYGLDDLDKIVVSACLEVIPSFKFRYLKFFESGEHLPAKNSRIYKPAFSKRSKYIYYELGLRNELYKIKDQDLIIIAKFFDPKGNLVKVLEKKAFIKKDWEKSWHSKGYKSDIWRVGQYTLKIYIQNNLFCVDKFNIVE